MKRIAFIMFIALTTLSCAHCTPMEDPPYIRTQPGINYCGAMCQKFTDMKCTGYYEDIDIDCKSDPAYIKMAKCKKALSTDAGKIKLTCKEFCEYEMTNSVPLNPKCLADNLKSCSEIETICKP